MKNQALQKSVLTEKRGGNGGFGIKRTISRQTKEKPKLLLSLSE